jgi:hypothetical protein
MPAKIFQKIFPGWNRGTYIDRDPVNNPPLLLDLYPGATAAYSLRRLDQNYTGYAVQVRRISDNATQNIGFVNNEFDSAALIAFASNTTAAVTIWYDQSGNGNNLTNATALEQPKFTIVNNKYALSFTASNGQRLISATGTNAIGTNGQYTAFGVGLLYDTSGTKILFHQDQGSIRIGQWFRIDGAGNRSLVFSDNLGTNATDIGFSSSAFSLNMFSLIRKASTAELWVNGFTNGGTSTPGVPSYSAGNMGGLYVGRRTLGEAYNGLTPEIILYPSDMTTDRLGIETNIRGYYGF